MREPFRELGRFAEPSLYILVSLSGGPKHGYAIMTDVEEISGSAMGPGTLYGALARLERRGWAALLAVGCGGGRHGAQLQSRRGAMSREPTTAS